MAAGANLSIESTVYGTPLMYASHNGNAEIVAYLLGIPAVHVTINTISGSYTALSSACVHGHTSIVELLLDAGANPFIPAGYFSPMDTAIRKGHKEIMQRLPT